MKEMIAFFLFLLVFAFGTSLTPHDHLSFDEREEDDYAISCYSGHRLVYGKTSPGYIDAYALSPTEIVVEDDEEGTTIIFNAACVWKEP